MTRAPRSAIHQLVIPAKAGTPLLFGIGADLNLPEIYPCVAQLERDICNCFDGIEFKLDEVQKTLNRAGAKLERIEEQHRDGLELLKHGDRNAIES